MRRWLRQTPPIHGIRVPGPRFTIWAWVYFILYVCVPVLAVGLVLDIVFYFVFRDIFGACYAILCLFE